MGVDISIYRQKLNSAYDENGEHLDACAWDKVTEFNCIDAQWVENASKSNRRSDVMLYGVEQEKQTKIFYIELKRQPQLENIDIQLGYYIHEDNCRGYWWKILGVVEQEITCNCWYLILTGDRLTGREAQEKRLPINE